MGSFQHLDNLLKGFTQDGLAGCACGVARNGEILYEGYHGLASIQQQTPITAETVYRLYSMTKVIVCAAALILFERGKFLLNEPLHAYIPEFKNPLVVKHRPNGDVELVPAQSPILIKHAFSMTAGLPYPFGEMESARSARKILDELKTLHGAYDLLTEMKALAKVPLAFEPGTQWLYGYGHDLVGALIEVVSGMPLGDFLQKEVFGPLGMKDTGYRYKDDIEGRMAAFYERAEDGSLSELPPEMDEMHQPEAKYESGGSGLYSTLRDYLIFTQMMANGGQYGGTRILGRTTIDLMRRNQLNEAQLRDFTNSYSAGYGYGLGVRTMMDPAAGNSNTPIGEFGWTGMAGTWASIDPEHGFSVVYMHQMLPNMEEHYHLRVRAAVYGNL
ncbi:beta-lactamase family protein [Paenibacillus sp. HN-1]|uniref:serine hydrolase domain-containing protein n=1 Tax=Paenibacillus TaxID=44249 RepID=UPI001CA9FC63|nr:MULTISPECIES: serine hydrolase domain-containing protein [Paenibacillus]MBY9078071.1 beta-lactamase family protein [Paenibacillus sp. CGMCC 1.18879]MBY9083812.1 beta-lactamase family protein [Paenibacillus sinensis]